MLELHNAAEIYTEFARICSPRRMRQPGECEIAQAPRRSVRQDADEFTEYDAALSCIEICTEQH